VGEDEFGFRLALQERQQGLPGESGAIQVTNLEHLVADVSTGSFQERPMRKASDQFMNAEFAPWLIFPPQVVTETLDHGWPMPGSVHQLATSSQLPL
jgi:hypothetical protein